MKTLSVIIPAYNECDTIEEAVARVRRSPVVKEIIVVDDFSADGTRELLQSISDPSICAAEGQGEVPVRLVLHERNMGKGMAIRTALAHVTGDVVIIQDADLEYDPDDYPAMIAPILSGEADVVYGSRFLSSRPRMRPANYIANRVLALAASTLFGARITDEATCYKAFRAGVIQGIPLTCRRFEFCPEVTAKVLRRGIRIVEVPIRYEARTAAEGKKIGWWDGVVALWTLLKYRVVW
ncbi:MAG: glycosyltransferase family 2 protein [Armatimonadetes bacterium]|nr:glycosyltransferase family 2 protein [Armatimonadota bacterium]